MCLAKWLKLQNSVHICIDSRRTKKSYRTHTHNATGNRHFEFFFSCFFLQNFPIFKRKLVLGDNSYKAQIYITYTTGCGDKKLSKRSTKVWWRAHDGPRHFAIWQFWLNTAIYSTLKFSPQNTFHVEPGNLAQICITTRHTKNPIQPIPTMQQEVCHFGLKL